MAIPSYNVTEPKTPLVQAEKPNFFKLFMNDVGLLAAMYMDGIQLKVLNGETDVNFGADYENAVAQELKAHGFEPTYYNSRIHGEVDFILERSGRVLPVEVKCGKHYERHSALGRLMSDPKYGLDEAIVFNADSMKTSGKILYAPIYMVMFLQKDVLPEKMIYDVGEPLKF